MESGTITTTKSFAIDTTPTLQRTLFDDFIAYIDRGEQTTKTYINNLRQFFTWLQQQGITKPTRQDIINYRQYLTTKCKPSTVKQYLQSVRQFFTWTAAENYYPNIAANIHAPKVRQDTHKKDALTAADVLTIEQSIAQTAAAKAAEAADSTKDTAGRIDRATEQGKRLFAMYQLAVTAGLRTIELSRANIKDIDYRNGSACIYVHGKGHSEADQKKPIAPQVYEALQDYIKSRTDNPTQDSPLFVATGNRSGGKRLATTTISTMLKKAMQQAGFDSERITAHSLRHTAGNTVMELTGDNLFITQQYMRHANPTTTEIYLHRDTEKQEADIAQKLYDHYHRQTEGSKATTEGSRADIETILQTMDAEQIKKLADIAQTMAK